MTNKQKQALLVYLGYDTGGVDGIWGARSVTATERFQTDYGIGNDGIFGPGTESRILEVVASGEKPTAQKPTTDPDGSGTGIFWRDIPNFTRQEFACPCPRCSGFPVEPAEKLVRAAQALRDRVGKPMHISSGVRCQAHNDELKGSAKNSRHVIGHAMDFRVEGMTAAQVLPLALATPGIVYAYAINERYVHMDIGN